MRTRSYSWLFSDRGSPSLVDLDTAFILHMIFGLIAYFNTVLEKERLSCVNIQCLRLHGKHDACSIFLNLHKVHAIAQVQDPENVRIALSPLGRSKAAPLLWSSGFARTLHIASEVGPGMLSQRKMRLEDVFITSDSTDILLGRGLIGTVTLCFHKISLEKEKQKSMNFQGFYFH